MDDSDNPRFALPASYYNYLDRVRQELERGQRPSKDLPEGPTVQDEIRQQILDHEAGKGVGVTLDKITKAGRFPESELIAEVYAMLSRGELIDTDKATDDVTVN